VGAPDGQREVVALLRGLTGDTGLETHISRVFRSQAEVYKLRKAVRLPFIDLTALEARHRYALRELTLNAPATGDLYLDVRPVLQAADNHLKLGGPEERGDVVDWVVRMARVPADDFLDAMAARGPLDERLLDAVGDAVATYHQALPPVYGVDSARRLRLIANGNVPSARAAGLAEVDIGRWHDLVTRGLAARAVRLALRSSQGKVRRGHGDLHLGNVCLWHGRPVPFDALEFDEALATTDLAYDLAFLLMDLDRRAGRPAANRVLNRYLARTRDDDLAPLLPPLLSVRAMVRAR
jgi:aminoglycoside phosphotransferase family enzyme